MIYLDNGATTLHKPKAVRLAVNRALRQPGAWRVSGGDGSGRSGIPLPESGRRAV